MTIRFRNVWKAALLATVLNCTGSEMVAPKLDVAETANRVARALALGLADTTVRAQLVSAMRSSPFVTHKLVLQDYMASASGQDLLAAAASRARISRADLGSMIELLPRMSFSVPRRADRLAWTGTSAFMLGATMDNDVYPERLYTSRGLTVRMNEIQSNALLLLDPLETLSRRANPHLMFPATSFRTQVMAA